MRKFELSKVVITEYMEGRIIAFPSALDEPMNGQDYFVEFWFFPNGYGLSEMLIGISIENDLQSTVESELARLIGIGYFDEMIFSILRKVKENDCDCDCEELDLDEFEEDEEDDEEEFSEAVRPLMEWLAKNKNPHTGVIVDSGMAELVEGTECFIINDLSED